MSLLNDPARAGWYVRGNLNVRAAFRERLQFDCLRFRQVFENGRNDFLSRKEFTRQQRMYVHPNDARCTKLWSSIGPRRSVKKQRVIPPPVTRFAERSQPPREPIHTSEPTDESLIEIWRGVRSPRQETAIGCRAVHGERVIVG